MAGLPTRRIRCLAPLLLLAVLCAPLAGSASAGHRCCSGMDAPCAPDAAPCASLAAAPCCHSAPAAAWPSAERECAQSLQASPARALHVAAPPALAAVPAPAPALCASPPRLSVVLRN